MNVSALISTIAIREEIVKVIWIAFYFFQRKLSAQTHRNNVNHYEITYYTF